MFEDVIELLKNKGLRGATMDMYVYPSGEFTIVPSGQSSKKEWIGSRNLDFKIKGNFNSMDTNTVIDKIKEGLYVSVNYEEKGIKATKTNVEGVFIENAKKDNFINYNKISFVLLAQANVLRATILTFVDKKGDEWVGKRENSTEFNLNQKIELQKYIEEKFCKIKR